ncbi:Diaminohydroxyphosphoribosylamino-pyrimidine deaminase, partial [Leucoagaricus sp. SymC.cos]
EAEHLHFLRQALDEARKCEPTPTAFCVGCVITTRWPPTAEPAVLSTGFSRELPGNTHAEANALTKARALTMAQLRELFPKATQDDLIIDTILANSDIYTTLEPCSIRTSGLAPCANAIIAAKVPRCYIGVGEPDDFVKCEGAQRLKDASVKVVWLKDYEKECLEVARTGHPSR